MMDRRIFLGSAFAAGIGLGLPRTALALDEGTARQFVEGTIAEVVELARAPGGAEEKAPQLREIMERRAAVSQLARFSAGRDWRVMTPDQQERYIDSFSRYFARIYSRRFQGYTDIEVTVDGTLDAGDKGILVKSSILRSDGPPVLFEWLVTDRTGAPLIADIIVEGVSTAVTQRNEIGAMIAGSPDIEAFLTKLDSV